MEQANGHAVWPWIAGMIAGVLLLGVLSAWFYLGTDIFLVYLEQGLSYCF